MKPGLHAHLVERSGGHCEACKKPFGLGLLTAEADHAFGRSKAEESEATVWLICRGCHHDKTNNSPDAATWLLRFAQHADKYGFAASAARARARLFAVEVRAGFGRKVVANG
jgi:5-methylcytosine-specific restriction endonuclease McrA